MLYMVGAGFDQAACAFVGQAIGAGKVPLARLLYTTFNYVAAITISITILIFYHFKDDIIRIYTDIPSVQAVAFATIPLLAFNSFPDMFKACNVVLSKHLGYKSSQCTFTSSVTG